MEYIALAVEGVTTVSACQPQWNRVELQAGILQQRPLDQGRKAEVERIRHDSGQPADIDVHNSHRGEPLRRNMFLDQVDDALREGKFMLIDCSASMEMVIKNMRGRRLNSVADSMRSRRPMSWELRTRGKSLAKWGSLTVTVPCGRPSSAASTINTHW